MEEGHGAEHRFQSNTPWRVTRPSEGHTPCGPHPHILPSQSLKEVRFSEQELPLPAWPHHQPFSPCLASHDLTWCRAETLCVLKSGVRAERAGGPPRADTRVLREEGGRPGSLRRTQSWGHSRVKGATERHDRAPRGLVMPLQKGGAAGSRQRGGGQGPRDTSCSFPDRVTHPKAGGYRGHPQRGHAPRDRRSPPGPGGWHPTHGPLGEAEGDAVPRRSWGCQQRQSLDRAPPWAAGHPSRPLILAVLPPRKSHQGGPFQVGRCSRSHSQRPGPGLHLHL